MRPSSTRPRSTGWRRSQVPTLILVGGLDLQAIQNAARQVTEGIAGAPSHRLAEHRSSAVDGTPRRLPTLLRDWLTLRNHRTDRELRGTVWATADGLEDLPGTSCVMSR